MDKKRKRRRKEPYKAVCPRCGRIILLNLKPDWKRVEVNCLGCTGRFWLTRPEEIPQIQKDFEAGDDYFGQQED